MKSIALSLALGATLASPAFAAEPAPPDRFAALEARLEALEAENRTIRAQAAATAAALQDARAEIAALQQSRPADAVVASAPADAAVAADPLPADVETDADDFAAVAAPADRAASEANVFNPAISLTLAGQYESHSLDADEYVRAGFPLVGEGGPGEDGLSLGESELSLSANIDERFYGQLTVALESEDGETEIGIEEAYVDTTALPGGFALRMGRFFSNIGYLNNHHAHTDAFNDRPLAYQAFLGGQYGDDGVQLRWIAPTATYVELGGELLRGADHPAGGSANGGVGAWTAFAHAGGDVGAEHSWLAGVSLLDARSDGGEDGFAGDVRLWLADFTWKWAPDGNHRDGGLQLRTEWFHETRDGTYADAGDPSGDGPWDGTRRGAYVEGVWRFDRTWEAGYRYDRLWADDDGPFASGFDPYRHSLMLAWHASEFSVLRLMLARDNPNADAGDDVLSLQYRMSLGAHGAHKF